MLISERKIPLLIAIMFPLLFGGAVRATPGHQITTGHYNDIIFRPILHREGYIQAWNVSFQGNGYLIAVTFIISNIGPGLLNNGVMLYLDDGHTSRMGTAEFSQKSLQAVPGRVDITTGKNNRLYRRGNRYYVQVEINDTRLNLELQNLIPGINISGGEISPSGLPSDFLRTDIPIPAARVSGELYLDGNRIRLNGVGGMEHFLSNHSPHTYARYLYLFRTYSTDRSLFLGGLLGDREDGSNSHHMIAYLEKGQLVYSAPVEKIEVLKTQADPVSGYDIPVRVRYVTGDERECQVLVEKNDRIHGLNILQNVSSLLRWVIGLLFARPYIVHYGSQMELTCARDPRVELKNESFPLPPSDIFRVSLRGLSSYYLIND